MAYVIKRTKGVMPAPPRELPIAVFKGKVETRSFGAFPDDVSLLKGVIRDMGYAIDEKDAELLWQQLSHDFYPWGKPKSLESCWLVPGLLIPLAEKHAMEYLDTGV